MKSSRSWVHSGSLLVIFLLTTAYSLPGPEARGHVCQSAEECFRNAASFSDGHPDQVPLLVERFRRVQETYPGTVWARRAGLRVGWALFEHDPIQALEYLRAAREDFPLLEDYVLLKLGRALGRMGSYHESALTFESGLESLASSVLRNQTSYEAGFAWFENGQCQRATTHLKEATVRDRDSPYAPRAFFVLAECAARSQRVPQTEQALREIWRNYPESPEVQTMQQILQSGQPKALLWNPSFEDYYRRAQTWYDSARFEAAIQDLERFLAGRPRSPRYEQGLFRLGMAHVRLKQYPQAERIFRRLVATSSAYTGKATVWLAKVYLRQDQGRLLLKLRDSVPPGLNVNERSRIHLLSGVWAEGENAIQQAVAAYESAYREADLAEIKMDALWRLGWLHYQQGAWKDAVESFHALAAASSDLTWQNRAYYWKARALERMGQDDEAQTLYQQVSAEWPMTYYGQLSQSRLQRPLHAGRGQHETLAPQSINVPTSSALQTNAHFQKAMELSTLGLRREAAEELLWVKKQYGDQPQTLYAVALHMMEVGDYESALLIAKRYFLEPLERRRVFPDSPLWHMAYPTGYLTKIRRYADPHVDPFLVEGIIREESLYNPKALSPVGAMGLMQLMPKTANRVARRLGVGPVNREDLLEGDLNVRLGVHYVGELLHEYQGNTIQAVAAYNAGPHAVKRWIAKFGDRDPDEFVELISYRETRRYVKRVITSYRIYQFLHFPTCSALALDRTC